MERSFIYTGVIKYESLGTTDGWLVSYFDLQETYNVLWVSLNRTKTSGVGRYGIYENYNTVVVQVLVTGVIDRVKEKARGR